MVNSDENSFFEKDYYGCLTKIRSLYPSFYSAEKAVADYVLENTDEVRFLSVSEMAENAGVAESTVVRFCQNLGFKGYQEFKITLSQKLVSPLQQIHEDIDDGDDESEITKKVFRANYGALEDTLRILDPSEIVKAVDAIDSCRKVFFFAVGSSSPIALDGYYRFLRLGIDCSYVLDPFSQMMSSGHFAKGTVFIGISHSGSSHDIVQAMKASSENGGVNIGITDYLKAPMLKYCDITLITSAKETAFRSASMSSRIAQLSIIDALYVSIAVRRKPGIIRVLQKTDGLVSVKHI